MTQLYQSLGCDETAAGKDSKPTMNLHSKHVFIFLVGEGGRTCAQGRQERWVQQCMKPKHHPKEPSI